MPGRMHRVALVQFIYVYVNLSCAPTQRVQVRTLHHRAQYTVKPLSFKSLPRARAANAAYTLNPAGTF